MNPISVGIHRRSRDAIPATLESHGYCVTKIDLSPRPINSTATEQRWLCARGRSAAVFTLLEGDSHPNDAIVTIATPFWLLLRYGKVACDQEVMAELTGIISVAAISPDD